MDKSGHALVGSAIGDAMGALNRMWAQDEIQVPKIWICITTLDFHGSGSFAPKGIWVPDSSAGGD